MIIKGDLEMCNLSSGSAERLNRLSSFFKPATIEESKLRPINYVLVEILQ